MKKNPTWIVVDNGSLFEGHQGHWMDCFFTNATLDIILEYCIDNQWPVLFRPMTDDELVRFPEINNTLSFLEKEYGRY